MGLGGGIFGVDGAECTFFIGEWGWLWVDGTYFGKVDVSKHFSWMVRE